jgi:hypothetical protein
MVSILRVGVPILPEAVARFTSPPPAVPVLREALPAHNVVPVTARAFLGVQGLEVGGIALSFTFSCGRRRNPNSC